MANLGRDERVLATVVVGLLVACAALAILWALDEVNDHPKWGMKQAGRGLPYAPPGARDWYLKNHCRLGLPHPAPYLAPSLITYDSGASDSAYISYHVHNEDTSNMGPVQRRILRIAKQYMGEPYGFGPGQYSCSKFTSIVMKRAVGVNMPYDVVSQLDYGFAPRRKKAGDLLFFDEFNKGPSHVAIYIGDGWVRHASSYCDVVCDSQLKYIDGFFAVRRIR